MSNGFAIVVSPAVVAHRDERKGAGRLMPSCLLFGDSSAKQVKERSV
jgi:hypothetical protein